MTDRTDTRQRIIDSARDVYLREGLLGLSMRKVGSLAGVSATAIYRHFDGKTALLSAILEEGFELFARYLWRGLEGETPYLRLRLTGTGYMHFALDHSAYYRVMFMSPVEDLGYHELPEHHQRKVSPTFQFLVDRVRECMDAEVIEASVEASAEASEADTLAAMIWSNCHGLVSLYLAGHMNRNLADDEQFAAFYDRATERFLRGLAP